MDNQASSSKSLTEKCVTREFGLSVPVDKVDNVEHYVGSVPATIACNDDGRSVRIFPKQLYKFYLYFPLDIFYRLHLFAVWWCHDDSNFVPVKVIRHNST